MSSRNDRFSFALAEPKDAPEILKVYESMDFKGDISVMYTRRPDPLLSLSYEGDKVLMPIMRDVTNGAIVGIGCWILRSAFIKGQMKRVCYLMSLKIIPAYQRRMPHLKEVYAFLYEQTKDEVDLYYTTILKENVIAQKMLEKKRPNMPEYRYRGDYTVYNIKTGGMKPKSPYSMSSGSDAEVKAFYHHHMKDFQLASPNLSAHGIESEDLLVMRSQSGEILATCAIWNQQTYKQHIVTGYGGVYKLLHHLPTHLLGYPSFPPVGSPINYASITGLCVKDNHMGLAKDFIRLVTALNKKYLFLMLGLHDSHPLCNLFQEIKHIKYQSKFYTVHFDEEKELSSDRPLYLEVGLL